MTEERIRLSEPVPAGFERSSRGPRAISAYIRRAIETGAYSEGDRLPPERQLAATFQAARRTVRDRAWLVFALLVWYRAVSAAEPSSVRAEPQPGGASTLPIK